MAAFVRLIGAGWRLLRADSLLPREIDALLPPALRMTARVLRLFAGPQARLGRAGERLAFSIVVNHHTGEAREAMAAIDEVASLLVR